MYLGWSDGSWANCRCWVPGPHRSPDEHGTSTAFHPRIPHHHLHGNVPRLCTSLAYASVEHCLLNHLPSDCLVLGSHSDVSSVTVCIRRSSCTAVSGFACTALDTSLHILVSSLLLNGVSKQGLGCCNNALRLNGQSLLELVPNGLSRTPLRLLLTPHGFGKAHVIELDKVLHYV